MSFCKLVIYTFLHFLYFLSGDMWIFLINSFIQLAFRFNIDFFSLGDINLFRSSLPNCK